MHPPNGSLSSPAYGPYDMAIRAINSDHPPHSETHPSETPWNTYLAWGFLAEQAWDGSRFWKKTELQAGLHHYHVMVEEGEEPGLESALVSDGSTSCSES